MGQGRNSWCDYRAMRGIQGVSSEEAGYKGTGKSRVGSNKGTLGGTSHSFPEALGAATS